MFCFLKLPNKENDTQHIRQNSATMHLGYFSLRAGVMIVAGIVVAVAAAGDRVVEEVHQACEGVHRNALLVVRLYLEVPRSIG